MSTIVVPRNNDNWVADAVVNFVGPIIGDWIKSEREKEINRKNNVAIHEAIKSLGLGNNDYSNLPPSMPNNNGGLLGGSSNGWENASRNMSDNPLTQFDNNTADIAPSVNAPATSTPNLPTQQHIPTPAEFLQTMYNVVGSNPKRFGLVNMENLQKLAAPIMAAYQADLTRQEKQKLADDFLNAAGDYAKQRNIMTSGYINGTVPYEAVNGATHNYEYENPHLIPGSYNAGGESYFYGYNPSTGEYNFNTQVNNSLTPQQKQQGEQWDREYGLKVRQQDFLENQARIARENPELKPQYGEDGTLYYVNPYTGKAVYAQNPDGEIIKVDPDSYSKRTPMNKNDNAFINYKKEENRQLQMTIRQKEKAIADPTVSEEIKERYRKEIDEHKAQIELNNKEIAERIRISQSQNTSQNNSGNSQQSNYEPYVVPPAPKSDFGADSIGGANNGVISTKFGAPRKRSDGSTYNHAGIDLPAPAGFPIKVAYNGEGYLKVKKVANQPNGYGNYIDLEGTIQDNNGKTHTVGIRYAHMQDGSVTVKEGDILRFGDLIGKVGNTGNSRGKNGGYHLHIETSIDGQLVDPQTFNEKITDLTGIARREIKNESESILRRKDIEQQREDTYKKAMVFFRNSKTGDQLSQYELENLFIQAEKGQIKGHPDVLTPEQVVELVKSQGFDEDFRQPNYQWNSPNGKILFINPKTNIAYTENDLKEIIEYGKQGGIPNVTNRNEAIAYLKGQGFEEYQYPDEKFKPTNTDYIAQYPDSENNIQSNNSNQGVGLTPFPTNEEKERADTQGSTGSNIARVPEAQNEAVLNGDKTPSNSSNNDEYNSEIAWTHPDGRTISKAEYDKRLREGNMSEEKAAQLYESLGYRRADNSHSPAPEGTDIINGTTPYAMQNQVNLLNGDYSPEVTGSTFMGETLPGISPHGVMAASLTPMGLSGWNQNNHRGTPVYIPNNQLNENDEPPAYNPYDVNADTGQPYDENDAYEQGFEYDDDASNGIVTPKVNNTGYNVLPIADLSNPAPRPTDSGNYLPPVGQRGGNHTRTLPPVGQTYSEIPAQDNTPRNAPKTSQQNQNNNQQTTYRGVRIPKREARRPGKIKTNTSYQDLKPIVDDSAKRHGLEPELVRAIIQVESKWDSNALSHVGAKGLMQLMPNTAREVGVRDAYDVAQNINGGSKYIARLIRRYKGDVNKALMAYNCGSGNVNKGRIPARSRNYARNVMAIYNRLKAKN